MASFTIPTFFTGGPPAHHFNLQVKNARHDPAQLNRFVSQTWDNLACEERFLGSRNVKAGKVPLKQMLKRRLKWRYRRSFLPFPSLPRELQDKIWEACLEPVTLTVLCLVGLDGNGDIYSKAWLLESPGAKFERRVLPVPLFHICRGSRAVAQRFYRHLEPGIFFSPRIDTLRLSLISSTKVKRHPTAERDCWYYTASASCVPGPFFRGDALFKPTFREGDMEEWGRHSSYNPARTDLKYSYSSFLHEYGPSYVFSRIPLDVVKEIQNLEVAFYYEPYASLKQQQELSHTATYFLQRNCPILDLSGLRHLSLKIGVVTYGAFKTRDKKGAKKSWHDLITTITSVGAARNHDGQRLGRLQSLEVHKVCAVTKGLLFFSKYGHISRRLHDARRRTLRRLGDQPWRP